MELTDIPEPAFAMHQIPRHAESDLPKQTLRDVMQYLVAVLEERHWIMVSIAGVMRHLGVDHPPFPRVGHAIPPLLSHGALVTMVFSLLEHILKILTMIAASA